DAACVERGILHQFERVEHRAGRHPGLADDLHRLFLGVLTCPGGDDLIDLGGALAARVLRVVARVAFQIFAADDLQQTLPVLGIGAAGEDIDVIVRAARLARVERRRHQPARLRPVAAAAQLCLPARLGARKRHAHVVDHRVLHRELQPASCPGLLPLVERPQNADRHQHAGPGIAKGGAGLDRCAVAITGDAGRAARRLRDHVEGEAFLIRAAGAEALDLAVDDAGVDLLDLVITKPQPLDRARRHVLDRDIGLFEQLLDDLQPARRFQIQRQRFLVGVELVEVPGVVVGLAGLQAAAGIAAPGVLDLDHFGAEPGQAFGAGGARLELREIDNPHAFETIQLDADIGHAFLPPSLRSVMPKSLAPPSAAGYAGGYSKAPSMPAPTHSKGSAAQISATHSPTTLRFHELTISTMTIPASPEASMSVKPRNRAWPAGPPPLPLATAYAICARITRSRA